MLLTLAAAIIPDLYTRLDALPMHEGRIECELKTPHPRPDQRKIELGRQIRLENPDGLLLVGEDQGEWGGSLLIKGSDGKKRVALKENVKNIIPIEDGWLVLTGLAHLRTNYGRVYFFQAPLSVEQQPKLLAELPGKPRASWLLSSGEVLFTYDTTYVLMNKAGTLERVNCLY